MNVLTCILISNQINMKKSISLVLGCFLANIILAQTFNISNNPTFDSVILAPSNPASNDSVNFIIYISNENDKRAFMTFAEDSMHFRLKNDTIFLTEYSYELSSSPTDKLVHTISIGQINQGQYMVLLINQKTTVNGTFVTTSYIDTAIFTLPIISSLPDDKNKVEYLMVYPNPSNEKLFVALKFNNKRINDINLFDLTGKQVLAKNNIIPEKTVEINIKNLEKGIYFIRITTNDNSSYIQKIVKM
ncbi:MAG: hypothetical protein COB85_08735 [Bacteroidetes bacterium]|nr:MAG: hypothetical protein COB85_08735 [Bacteroidota bacterium]